MNGGAMADVWYVLIFLILTLYAVLDGFDLGVGLCVLLEGDERRRGQMMQTLSGVWHANQTWLVILGGSLFGAFPVAYAAVLSALYLPVLALVLTLGLRGACLEYRYHARRTRLWSLGFGLASLAAVAAQAFILGAVLQGLPVANGAFTGDAGTFLSPLALPAGLVLAYGYLLLGGSWLAGKTGGLTRRTAVNRARIGLAGLVLSALLLAAWTYLAAPGTFARTLWREPSLAPWLVSFAAVAAVCLIMLVPTLRESRRPFPWAAGLFAAGSLALAGGLHPRLLPPDLTLAIAAAPETDLAFMAWVMVPMLGLIGLYTIYQYHVFRAPPAG